MQRWTLIPLGRRSRVTVTSKGMLQCFQNPQSVIAEAWLSAAPGPQASTAALARSSGVVGGRPTE